MSVEVDKRCLNTCRGTCGESSAESNKNNVRNVTSGVSNPQNINIENLYVYNFPSPDSVPVKANSGDSPSFKKPKKVQSPAGSSGPFCRICHEGDVEEDLVSLCRCTGTVGLVHLSCMERWLSISDTDVCEICSYQFITMRTPKSFLQFLQSSSRHPERRRNFMGDAMCFFLLTPLAVVSSYLCVQGSKKQIDEGNSLEAGCLMALATFLMTIYFIWDLLTLRYHLKCYLKWRTRNQNVKVLRVRRLPSVTDVRPICHPSRTETASRNDVSINIPEPRPTQNQAGQPIAVSGISTVSTYPQYDFIDSNFMHHLTVMYESTV